MQGQEQTDDAGYDQQSPERVELGRQFPPVLAIAGNGCFVGTWKAEDHDREDYSAKWEVDLWAY